MKELTFRSRTGKSILSKEKKLVEKALYIGPNAELYLESFFPRYFSGPIVGFEWPQKTAKYSRLAVKYEIMNLLKQFETRIVFLHLDYDPLFYSHELVELGEKKMLVGIFGDDSSLNYFSSEIALYCDLIFTTDPLQINRYKTLGIPALPHLYEIGPSRYQDLNQEREIDILIYGSPEKNRLSQTQVIKREFVDKHIVDISGQRVPFEKLVDYLNKSKITVNWNYTWQQPIINNYRDYIASKYTGLKGRPFEASLCGCLTISSPSAVNEQIFGPSLPTFNSNEELIEQIKFYLDCSRCRKLQVKKLKKKTMDYLKNLEVDISNNLVQRKDKRKDSSVVVDEVVATFHLIELHKSKLFDFKFGLFISAASLNWKRVIWRFAWQHSIIALKIRIEKWIKK